MRFMSVPAIVRWSCSDSLRSDFHSLLVTRAKIARSTIRLSRSRGQLSLDYVDHPARPRRHDRDPVGEHRRLVEGVRNQEHGAHRSAATAAAPRRPSAGASADRVRRSGSSSRISRGSLTSVRAMHTRWRMPPESWAG